MLQRNKLLKDYAFRADYKEVLEVLDIQLVRYGTELIKKRCTFIRELNTIIGKIHTSLCGGKEQMLLEYEANTDETSFATLLKKYTERDLRQKTTTIGPHRDDLSFIVNGIDIRRYGSQGQQRTAALSLKLSEIEIVKHFTGDTPVLLLDDVLSELDSNRQNYLLNNIQNVQTMLTCTGLDDLINHRFSLDRVYRVTDGMVTVENQL